MDRYDRGWWRPDGQRGPGPRGGYDAGMRGRAGGMPPRGGGWAAGPHGWDEYGRDYDHPRRGLRAGWTEGGPGWQRGGGWPDPRRAGWDQGRGRGYDRGYAREPFVPESYYREQPGGGFARGRMHDGDAMWDRRPDFDGFAEPDDDDLAHAVRASLFQDTWLDAERIEVEVEDGIVRLTGEVDDFLEARYAWDDAWETDGVRGVINQITVRTDRAQPAKAAVETGAAAAAAPGEQPGAKPGGRAPRAKRGE